MWAMARPTRAALLNAIDQDPGHESAAREALSIIASGQGLDGSSSPLLVDINSGSATVTPSRTSTVNSTQSHTTSGTPSTSSTVLSANASRLEVTIVNDSDTVVYLGIGTGAAVLNAGVRLNANGGTWTSNVWTGQVKSICASASKVLTVVELG